MRRGQIGWVVGSIVQVGAIATGFLVPAMFFLGALFGLLWVLTYVLGQRHGRDEPGCGAPDRLTLRAS